MDSIFSHRLFLFLLPVQYAPLPASARSVQPRGPGAGPVGVAGRKDEGGAAAAL